MMLRSLEAVHTHTHTHGYLLKAKIINVIQTE